MILSWVPRRGRSQVGSHSQQSVRRLVEVDKVADKVADKVTDKVVDKVADKLTDKLTDKVTDMFADIVVKDFD